MKQRSLGEKIFNIFNILFMIFLIFVTLYPLWYVLIASFSSPIEVARGNVVIFPRGFDLSALKTVINTNNIWTSYANTIFYSVAGTAVSMVLTLLAAYPLSKRRLKGRRVLMFFLLFTMWFGAGMMPTFQNFRNLNLLDNRLGIILCYSVATFYVILLRTFFESIPDSMEESAKIDGANDWRILFSIYLPLSVPALATLTMYYFVGRWNSFFWSMLLLRDQSKIPLQVLLRRLIVEVSAVAQSNEDLSGSILTEKPVVYSTIVISVIPMLILYPFIQRFFVKGIMVGAIKG